MQEGPPTQAEGRCSGLGRILSPEQKVHRLLTLPGQDVVPVYLFSLMSLTLASDEPETLDAAETWASFCRHLLVPASYTGEVITESKGILSTTDLVVLKAVYDHGYLHRASGRCSVTGIQSRVLDDSFAKLRRLHLLEKIPGERDGLPGRPRDTYEPGWALELILPVLDQVPPSA